MPKRIYERSLDRPIADVDLLDWQLIEGLAAVFAGYQGDTGTLLLTAQDARLIHSGDLRRFPG